MRKIITVRIMDSGNIRAYMVMLVFVKSAGYGINEHVQIFA